MKSSYITSAQRAEQLPDFPHPEVAIVGRSNVGKSSLLNALLEHRGLARTSATPGRTQMVNFFAVENGDRQVILADLPGYGYSATGKSARRDWAALVEGYLKRRRIRSFLFLIDARRAHPLAQQDLELLRSLVARRATDGVTLVLTKTDKMRASDLAKTLAALKRALATAGIEPRRIASVSTLKKRGLVDLRRDVLGLLDAS